VNDNIDALFAEALLQPGVERQFAVEQFGRRPVRLDVQIHVAAAPCIVHAGAEQVYARLRSEGAGDLVADDLPLLLIQPHGST